MHLHLINTWATTGVMSVPNKFFWQEKGQILILPPNSLGAIQGPIMYVRYAHRWLWAAI
jgi:hypothetical protein